MAISTGKVVALIQAMGGADPAVIEAAVQDWLDDHPEATTTVADGSITEQKLATSIAQKLGLISSLSDEIDALDSDVTDLKSALSEKTGNLISGFKASTNVRDVIVSSAKPGFISLNGTASSSGGRTIPISDTLTLGAGTYEFTSKEIIPANLSFMVEVVSANTILATIDANTRKATFTLSEEKNVYVGVNVVNTTVYSISDILLQITKGTSNVVLPAISANDYIVRSQVETEKEKTALIEDLSVYAYETLKDVFPFMVGAFTSQGAISTNTKNRIISANEYTTNAPLLVYVPVGYRYGIVIYSGSSHTDSGWLTGSYIIPQNSTFRIQVARSTEDASEVITDVKDCDLYRNLTLRADQGNAYANIQFVSTKELSVEHPWAQGACLVGTTLVGFNASSDDHSTNATVRTYDTENWLTQVSSFAHNLGHSATADYNVYTDTMLVANGTYEAGVSPTLYFIKHASNKINNGTDILVSNPDVVAVDVTGLTGQGVGACFGESSQYAYLIMLESASQYDLYDKKYIHKMLLGKGNNNLITKFANNNFGVFISGCAENEYNGTMHLIETYVVSMFGELQGLKYRNGYLYMTCDTPKITRTKTPYMAKIKITNSGAELEKFLQFPSQNAVNALVATEAEGFVFDGFKGYVALWAGANGRVVEFNSIF